MNLALAALLLASSAAATNPPPLQVYFFDVGEGDAALIISPTGKSVLIDAGPASTGSELRKRLEALITPPLDLALLTHSHLDHLGGMTEALSARGARQFIDSGFPDPSPARTEIDEYLRMRGIPIQAAKAGERFDLGGGAALVVLAPLEPFMRGTRSDTHSNSLVVRLDYEKLHVLFAADLESEAEAKLVEAYRAGGLKADVLKVARHGASTSSTSGFLKEVQPSRAVVSLGAGNGLDLPSGEALSRLKDAGASVLRTDVDGELLLTSDGSQFTLIPTPPIKPGPVVASKRPAQFHTADCPTARHLKANNKVVYLNREAALKAGKTPARDCNP